MRTNLFKTTLPCLLAAALATTGCDTVKNTFGKIKMPFTSDKAEQPVTSEPFGTAKLPDNQEASATLWTLRNKNGLVAKVTDYGATLVEMHVPDKGGRFADVVNGFDSVEGYQGEGNQYFGCTTGRVCNRIAKGKFTLNGQEYQLAINNEPNHLHGGNERALPRVMWKGAPFINREGQGIVFSYTSPDGEEGYPGTLVILVTYTLTHDDELRIEYEAKLEGNDKSTPINLTNHAYWNLAGAGSGTVLNHVLTLNADKYTKTDDTLIPTGEIVDVEDTPLDFRTAHIIGERIPADDTPWKGYDHNFVVNGNPGEMRVAAVLKDPSSGRVMTISTVEPGIQFYSGNFLNGQTGKKGKTYVHRGALCLETQHFPDSVNHDDFPSTILRPGATYRTSTIHKFTVEE